MKEEEEQEEEQEEEEGLRLERIARIGKLELILARGRNLSRLCC